LANAVNGQIYRATPQDSYRPRDSKAEDILVIFTTGDAEQIQTGIITINIYVPDIENPDNGVLVEDGRRCEELEIAAASWVKSLTADKSDYKFKLQQTIYTEAEPEINQHFVVIKLNFKSLSI
ncbi:MAG: hypothetical protein LBG18_09250, partial [Mediterranea sp.]|nr:hypothetical protein [Mediterranea sp.]